MLIRNYGYNMINLYYIQNFSKFGYIITDKEYKQLKKEIKIDYLKKKDIDNNDFSFSENKEEKVIGTIEQFTEMKIYLQDYIL